MLEVDTAFAVFAYAGAFALSALGCLILSLIVDAIVHRKEEPTKNED